MENAGQGYVPPRVLDYGDLVALTRSDATMLHVGIGGAGGNSTSTTLTPGGGGGGGGGTVTPPPNGSPLGGTLPAVGGGGGSGSPAGAGGQGGTLGAVGSGGGGGGAGGGGSGGGGGGSLPFTGFYVAILGALGSGLTAAGVALRRRLNRGRNPG